jgi:hypothetical protein
MAIGPYARNILEGLAGNITSTQESATREQFEQAQTDWRVKLALSEEIAGQWFGKDSILAPLSGSGGVIFPYTPQISVAYSANYEPTELTHSNYKVFHYKNSAVDQITITAQFTAQDTFEANYLLATIHFFRSVTKMFYGQDESPKNGAPPPLCFLSGLGTYQFNNHPLVVSSFTYTLPDKVDYIRAQATSPSFAPNNEAPITATPTLIQRAARLGLALLPGGQQPAPVFAPPRPGKFSDATYVPTEMQMQLTLYPVMSRQMVSNKFSLQDYATGKNYKEGMW